MERGNSANLSDIVEENFVKSVVGLKNKSPNSSDGMGVSVVSNALEADFDLQNPTVSNDSLFETDKKFKSKKKGRIPKKKDSVSLVAKITKIDDALVKENTKQDKKEKQEDGTAIVSPEEKIEELQGGYGTVRYSLSGAAYSPYMNYEKLFSYLGNFKARTAYEGDAPTVKTNSVMEDEGKFFLIDSELMNQGILTIKYKVSGEIPGGFGLVPPRGISSAEWENFKLWTIVDPVMYNLKLKTV